MSDGFPPFSAAARHAHLAALAGETWDLLVVGGGITGAAGRGLRVALVDAGDVGRGTSSRSSRLIHGGLRYLETYDFRLVFEASAARCAWRAAAENGGKPSDMGPGAVRPVPRREWPRP